MAGTLGEALTPGIRKLCVAVLPQFLQFTGVEFTPDLTDSHAIQPVIYFFHRGKKGNNLFVQRVRTVKIGHKAPFRLLRHLFIFNCAEDSIFKPFQFHTIQSLRLIILRVGQLPGQRAVQFQLRHFAFNGGHLLLRC